MPLTESEWMELNTILEKEKESRLDYCPKCKWGSRTSENGCSLCDWHLCADTNYYLFEQKEKEDEQ